MKPRDKNHKLVKAEHSMPNWTIVNTPNSTPSLTKELLNPDNQGAGINKIEFASDSTTLWALIRRGDRNGIRHGGAQVMLYRSIDGGMSWSDTQYSKLSSIQSKTKNGTFVWDFVLAPDDPNVIAVVCANIHINPLHQDIWISADKGEHWENTQWPPRGIEAGADFVSSMDISINFGSRKILIGTRDGTGLGTNNLHIMDMQHYSQWSAQDSTGSPPSCNAFSGDILAAKFSPTFVQDFAIVVIYSDGTAEHSGTWLATGVHDIATNNTKWQEKENHVEIKNSDNVVGSSPHVNEIITARLALPFDFNANISSYRRIYVSTDAMDRPENTIPNRGVYRIDNDVIYTLMDNSATYGSITAKKLTRRVSSIAYFGTCATGKLLVGEVLGDRTRAAVATWFTDSPTAFPVPCWYPSLKSTTGAAGKLNNPKAVYELGYGNAYVIWSPLGNVAFVATGAASLGPFAMPEIEEGALKPQIAWPAGYVNVIPCDESAFGISRNNGETWNQLSLINTLISELTDMAPSPDGRTIYLASVNKNVGAQGFDSVWRSSSNPDVISPLPLLPVGTYWERIFTHVTAPDCTFAQTNMALLRIVPYCADPTGEIVAWAVYDPTSSFHKGIVAWSPDFGDYWAIITPRNPIQDFCFETRSVMYFLSPVGLVQKIPYTGTDWSSSLPDVNSTLLAAHTIAAYPKGKVIVGSAAGFNANFFATSYCGNFNTNDPQFATQALAGNTGTAGNIHVAFDSKFGENNTYYIGDDAACRGSVFRNNPAAQLRWRNADMMAAINGAVGGDTPRHVGQYGIALAFTGQTLYAAHGTCGARVIACGVNRTTDDGTGNYGPLSGLPEPGIAWDHLAANLPAGVCFTLEPSSLKICGCCSLDTDSTLYAIDCRQYSPESKIGMLWACVDYTAKRKS
jgi:hypothetical protein